MPPWPEWQFEYMGSRFLGKLLGLWSSLWVSLVRKLFRLLTKSTVGDRVLLRQEAFQDGGLHVVNVRSLENSHPEGSLARRWCKWRSNPSGSPSVCKRLVGNFPSLDLFLKLKAAENSCYCPAIAQTDIHRITWRKGELITVPSHVPRRCQSSERKLH